MALCVASLFKRGLTQLERVVSFGSSAFFTPFSGRDLKRWITDYFAVDQNQIYLGSFEDFKRMQGAGKMTWVVDRGSTWYKVLLWKGTDYLDFVIGHLNWY